MKLKVLVLIPALLLMLAACDSKDKEKLPGRRIDVLSDSLDIAPDESLDAIPVTIPDPKSNENWRQAGGSPSGITGNLELSGFKEHTKAEIGDGYDWDQPLYSAPIIAYGMVFAMDSRGYITAHDVTDIRKIKWKNKSLVEKGKPEILGGGLAAEDNRIYATSGRGNLVALDATNGKEVWRQSIGIPLRAAPKASNNKVYVVSVDNQLFAFNATDGTQLWSHRGINENAGFLAEISPAVSAEVVIAPYSSGEIHALDTMSGQDLWTDSLLKPNHVSASAGFAGIGGTPIIKDDVVYAVGTSGSVAAFDMMSGRTLWEQTMSSLNAPWIADDFMYVLTNRNELVAIFRADGRIKWIKQLPNFRHAKKKKDPYSWLGPVMAGGQLIVAEPQGSMLIISPKDGKDIKKLEIPENITVTPIVAGGRMYILTKDAKLHVLY